MKTIGCIPARYNSTRFPGKPLAVIEGKTVIERVYTQAKKSSSLDRVVIATDDERIYRHAQTLGAEVYMTSIDHQNGTERCYEAYTLLNQSYDYIINIQGDEPFIQPSQINLLHNILDGNVRIATLIKKIENNTLIHHKGTVKTVVNEHGDALYFSRSPIPYLKDVEKDKWITHHHYFKHIGLYAYRTDVLEELVRLSPSALEQAESLEQLRWLESGYCIKTCETLWESQEINTPDDIDAALSFIKKRN